MKHCNHERTCHDSQASQAIAVISVDIQIRDDNVLDTTNGDCDWVLSSDGKAWLRINLSSSQQASVQIS